MNMPDFYEFFAGGGMARAGLGEDWRCVFANDIDAMKASAYRSNWGGDELVVDDVANLTTRQIPGEADLAWASFPCQDLSLAGSNEGIGHRSSKTKTRSGTFWPFWQLIRLLVNEGRAPRIIVLENVLGALTSHEGKDFAAISSALSGSGYRFGAVVIDARLFVPQSRPRLFIVAVRRDLMIPNSLREPNSTSSWHPKALLEAYAGLSTEAKSKWVWWNLPAPTPRIQNFVHLIEDHPRGVEWHSKEETERLLSMMNEVNLAKVQVAQRIRRRTVGAVYRRIRPDGKGGKCQRAEVRFDNLAGCLRTPTGGSSRQTILVVNGNSIRSRLLSPREAARLMGIAENYVLPIRYNDAYHLAGDGVVVPVVRFLAAHLLEPILIHNEQREFAEVAAA